MNHLSNNDNVIKVHIRQDVFFDILEQYFDIGFFGNYGFDWEHFSYWQIVVVFYVVVLETDVDLQERLLYSQLWELLGNG